jgi:hypothetical protein
MKIRKRLIALSAFAAFLLICPPAFATLINFDDQGLIDGQLFGNPMQVITLTNIGGTGIDVTFSGGTILTNATNFPANNTSVYGTYFGGSTDYSYTNPMTITFSQQVTNFYMDLYNGQTSNRTFTVSDDIGNSTTATLVPNTASGQTLVAFAATGSVISIFDVTPGVSTWDFLIDNIHFNEPLPSVPEPSTMLLLVSGLVGLAGLRKKFQK